MKCAFTAACLCCCRYWTGRATYRESRSYDMWSVGVVWLELIVGTPHVFAITHRTQAFLDTRLKLNQKSQVEVLLKALRFTQILNLWQFDASFATRAFPNYRHAHIAKMCWADGNSITFSLTPLHCFLESHGQAKRACKQKNKFHFVGGLHTKI